MYVIMMQGAVLGIYLDVSKV